MRVVVLHEVARVARRLRESLAVVALEKEAAVVRKHARLEEQHAGQIGRNDVHARSGDSKQKARGRWTANGIPAFAGMTTAVKCVYAGRTTPRASPKPMLAAPWRTQR